MSGAGLFVIINHTAARARKAWPRVREALEGAGVAFEAHESTRQGETEERTRAALDGGFGTVAAVGGDGTLSAAANGFFRTCAELSELSEGSLPRAVNPEAALAPLPAGTGDDFARGLSGGRRETLDAWVARLVRHCRRGRFQEETAKRIDLMLGSAGGGARRFVCLNAATLGIGAEVAERVAAQGGAVRRLPGEARFALAALPRLVAWRDRRVRVIADGRVWEECGTNLLAVANGTYAGGGMNFSPGARLDDGLLDVLAVADISRPALLRELARVHTGGHVKSPHVKLTRAAHVRIETLDPSDSLGVEADGDPRGHTPADFRVMPAALRVVC
ncbi:MAG: diacylglycerol kinase family lipid kinase [Acidobacteria bacterium]|nr:diacylglycerol kinase family lipid kinase [Acidobacteriota bacterium]